MSAPIEIPKNSSEVYRVQPTEYKGHKLIDLRVWYRPKDGGDLRPSPKGISIKPDALGDVIAALKAAGAAISESAPEATA